MPSDILTKEAIANSQEVVGDQSQLLGEPSDKPVEAENREPPFITVKRGSPFIQEHYGWKEIKDANGDAVIPQIWQGTRFAQWFRFKNDHLEWGGNVWNEQSKRCDSKPAIEEMDWIPVRGIPGILTVHKSGGETESFFSIENATNPSVWPLIPAREHKGWMQTFKGKHGIFVAKPGKFIHRIGDGTVSGHPCSVIGCMIPGKYEKDMDLANLRTAKHSGSALDRIIECLGGWKENLHVRIGVSD